MRFVAPAIRPVIRGDAVSGPKAGGTSGDVARKVVCDREGNVWVAGNISEHDDELRFGDAGQRE